MSSPSRWALDGIFLMNHEKVMPWSSYSWLFNCPKIETFDTLMIFKPFLWNYDQDLIKWWLWLQNKMLTKNFDFWLPNDHFAPAIDCEAFKTFDCAIWCCEPWSLTCRCLTMYIGIWDLIGTLKTSNSLQEPKTLTLTVLGGCLHCAILNPFEAWSCQIFEEYGRANFRLQQFPLFNLLRPGNIAQ